MGEALFTFEEFNTIVIQIKGLLSSRPLPPLFSNHSDLNALTPSHFLIVEGLMTLSQTDLTLFPLNRLAR